MRLLSSLVVALLLTGCNKQPNTEVVQSKVTPPKILEINEDTSVWWKNATFYQIWVGSFRDSDGDGHGDLNGIVEKLDYLKGLNVEGIWLTPINKAPTYHGYDTVDYYALDANYGSMEDFENFIAKAHEKDIKVLLDLVLNHVSNEHPWFVKSSNREEGFEDYFMWRDEMPEGWGQAWGAEPNPHWVWHWNEQRQQYYYAAFGSNMPDLNLENQEVVDEIYRIAEFWLDKGVDGFRLDAVRYAVEDGPLEGQADTDSTIAFWTGLAKHVRSISPDALMIGEAWTDPKTIAKYNDNGQGMPAAFDFDYGYLVKEILNQEFARSADFGSVFSLGKGASRDDLWQNLLTRKQHSPFFFYAPFLANHDQHRLIHDLNNEVELARVAASLLLTNPGPIFLYYGEEIAMPQHAVGDDQFRRSIMLWDDTDNAGFNESGTIWLDDNSWFPWRADQQPWWSDYWQKNRNTGATVAAQAKQPNSLYNHYKTLLEVRDNNPEIYAPDSLAYHPVANESVWILQYNKGNETAWAVINLNPYEAVTFSVPEPLIGDRLDQVSGATTSLKGSHKLMPGQVLIF